MSCNMPIVQVSRIHFIKWSSIISKNVIALEALKALCAFTLCLLVSSTSSVQILCRTLSDLSMPFTERLRAPADHG